MSEPANSQLTLRYLWWLQPTLALAFVLAITLTPAILMSERAFALYGTPKYLRMEHFLVALSAVGAFGLGQWLAQRTGTAPHPAPKSLDLPLLWWFRLAAGLSLFGFAIWLLLGIKNGFTLGLLLNLFDTSNEAAAAVLRFEVFRSIPGVTTCTQFGLAAAILGLWLELRGVRGVRLLLAGVIFCAAFRVLLFSERLALLEILVSGGALGIRFLVLGKQWSRAQRLMLRVFPVFAIAGLLVFFGTFEYFRTWFRYQKEFDNVAEFTLWRAAGYYATSHNNGALTVEIPYRRPLPYVLAANLWKFPLVKGTSLDYESITGVDHDEAWAGHLKTYAQEEYNNAGGLFIPLAELGWVGSTLFWFGLGFCAGKAYRGFLAGSLGGCFFYPLILVAIADIPRIQYLTETRTFPAIVLLGMVVYYSRFWQAASLPRCEAAPISFPSPST